MVDFNEKIPSGLPKLPDNYWAEKNGEKTDQQSFEINIFDNNLKASMADISIFNKKQQ